MSNWPPGVRNFNRLKLARLQAVSSRNMYSLHGFDALIRAVFAHVCQLLIDRKSTRLNSSYATLFRSELQQVEAGQVASRVVQKHVLAARIRRIDSRRLRACVPVVDRRVELHPRVTALPGLLCNLEQQGLGTDGVDRPAVLDGLQIPTGCRRLSFGSRCQLHELVGS